MVNSYRLSKNPRYAAVSRIIEELFVMKKKGYGVLNESSMQKLP